MARIVTELQITVMHFNDRPHDRHPHPKAVCLRRRKRFKHNTINLLREPAAGVKHGQFNQLTFLAGGQRDAGSGRRAARPGWAGL